jgi:hypothetical protein
MIFFKKKKLVLNCVTNRRDVAMKAPVDYARNFYPDWWKALPKTLDVPGYAIPAPTMKSCVGLQDLYQHGLMLPMWCDLNVDVTPIGENKHRHHFTDGKSNLYSHPPEQRGTFADENLFQHIKLDAPWRFQCDEEIPFVWSEPLWNMDDITQHRTLPGTVEYKYQNAVNINMLIVRRLEVASVLIPFGQPLAHLTPLTERELVINIIEDPQLFDKMYNPAVSFSHSYKKSKEAIKKNCPFSK